MPLTAIDEGVLIYLISNDPDSTVGLDSGQ